MFMNKLIKLDYYAILATKYHEEINVSKTTTSDDVALFVSYSGNNHDLNQNIPILKMNGCKIITITSNPDSVSARSADVLIPIPDKENEEKMATFYSQLSFHYILSILYSLLHLKIRKHN